MLLENIPASPNNMIWTAIISDTVTVIFMASVSTYCAVHYDHTMVHVGPWESQLMCGMGLIFPYL